MHDQEPALHWLDCGGGPLILLSGEYVAAWSGYTRADVSAGTLNKDTGPSERTNYERALSLQEDLGLVAVDRGQGLVMRTEPMAIAWWAISPAEGILVCWMVSDVEAAVLQSLAPLEEQLWAPSGITFLVGRHPLYLFDAIVPGREAAEYLVEYLLIELDEGRYGVDTGHARPAAQTELLLHRFRRQ